MKACSCSQNLVGALVTLTLGCGGLHLNAAPAPKPAKAAATHAVEQVRVVPKSVFVVPTKSAEGCDPFFPDSARIFGRQVAAPKVSPKANVSALVLNGLSGTPAHRLAMINGHTLAEGETAEISVPGGRVQIKCVEIKSGSVVIEANGQRQELHLPKDLF